MSYVIENQPFPQKVKALLHNFLARNDIASKRIMLYSAGTCCRYVLDQESLRDLNITAILDRDSALIGTKIAGIEVIHPNSIESARPEIIAIVSPRFHDSIYRELLLRCKALSIELVDLCGSHPGYRRFPGVKVTDFPDGFIISDFLPLCDHRVFRDLASLLLVCPKPHEVYVCFENDQLLSKVTRTLRDANISFYGIGNSSSTSWDASPTFEAPQGYCPHVMFKDDQIRQAIIQARDLCERFDICSHFDVRDFGYLLQFIRETRRLPGQYVEIGVFRGTSAAVAATYMNLTGDPRRMYLFDTFSGFSYSVARTSMDAVWNGTHEDTSMTFVSTVLKETGIVPQIQKLNICVDDMPAEIGAISMVNIDVDLYEAVRDALKKVSPIVVEGGVIICEDYGHTPGTSGANMAVHEFVADHGSGYLQLYLESGQMCLIKKKHPY
jgi:hypothetical protein